MPFKVIVKKNAYFDSVTLMSLSGRIKQQDGVEEVIVSMATPMNKELLGNVGMSTEETNVCTPNDLIIAVKADSEEVIEATMALIDEQLHAKKPTKKKGARAVKTIHAAIDELPTANMAVISVPGEFAARETRLALEDGLHVMLFSDNVTIEQERTLKELARDKGLLVMGPDCGTAIINQAGLCFANKVRRGDIGLVAASGTGLQEVTVQIHRLGAGISQAIGTGGRDLHEDIGGIMMIQGLKALILDPETKVIVLISKPPAPSVQEKILSEVRNSPKPVIVCFIDGDVGEVEKAGAIFSNSLYDAAKKAVQQASPTAPIPEDNWGGLDTWANEEKKQLAASQKYVRGLFCGGTLTSEALSILRKHTPTIASNVAKKQEEKISDLHKSNGTTLLDLGDDAFTVGRPHPMIEPALRNERLLQEAADPETAVLLLDFEIGYGSHEDPVGQSIATIQQAQALAKKEQRHLPIVAYILGTDEDKQNYDDQKRRLVEAGVYVAKSNEEACVLAAKFIR